MEKYCPKCRQKRNSRSNFCDLCGTQLLEREGRIKLPKGMYDEVYRRDGYRCKMCGASKNDGAELTIDHIKPLADGGTNDINNLQTLCKECNENKADLNLPSGLEIDIETKQNELKLLNNLLAQEEEKLSKNLNDNEKLDVLFNIKQLKEKHIPPVESELEKLTRKYKTQQEKLKLEQQEKERKERLFKKLYVNLSDMELRLLNDYLDMNFESNEEMLKYLSKNYSENEIIRIINLKKDELYNEIDKSLDNKFMLFIKSRCSLTDGSKNTIINYLMENYNKNEIFSMIESYYEELFNKYNSSLDNRKRGINRLCYY